MTLLKFCDRAMSRLQIVAIVTGISGLVMLIFAASLFRWVGAPIQWAADLAQLLFAWVVFLGADLALANRGHAVVDILSRYLPPLAEEALFSFWYLLIALFSLLCIFYGVELCLNNAVRRLNSLPLSRAWMNLAVPVGFLYMLKTSVIGMMSSLRRCGKMKK